MFLIPLLYLVQQSTVLIQAYSSGCKNSAAHFLFTLQQRGPKLYMSSLKNLAEHLDTVSWRFSLAEKLVSEALEFPTAFRSPLSCSSATTCCGNLLQGQRTPLPSRRSVGFLSSDSVHSLIYSTVPQTAPSAQPCGYSLLLLVAHHSVRTFRSSFTGDNIGGIICWKPAPSNSVSSFLFLKWCCSLHEACNCSSSYPNPLFTRLPRQTRAQLRKVLPRLPLKLNPPGVTDLEELQSRFFHLLLQILQQINWTLWSMRSNRNQEELLISVCNREMKSVQAP